MTDTLEIVRNVVKDPVPLVNTVVIFGLTEMEWELFFTVAVGFASLIWTGIRIANEVKKLKDNKGNSSEAK
jgi:hypothetical protein